MIGIDKSYSMLRFCRNGRNFDFCKEGVVHLILTEKLIKGRWLNIMMKVYIHKIVKSLRQCSVQIRGGLGKGGGDSLCVMVPSHKFCEKDSG